MRELTYLFYIIYWLSLVVGGSGYAVFVLGHSGWWFMFSIILLGATITPSGWFFGEDYED